MHQPQLGRKITELRKAKGLTQEELAQSCNLNVRTIQRIESAEVMPRSYTVRLIFSCLDAAGNKNDFFNSTTFVQLVQQWMKQLNAFLLDLFNLKTNTMKKLVILSVPFLLLVGLFLSVNLKSSAQERLEVRNSFEHRLDELNTFRWFNAEQLDSLKSFYMENACMMPDQGMPITGVDNIINYYKSLYEQGMRFAKITSLSRFFGDSLAIDRGTWSLTLDSAVTFLGSYLTQWHYVNGKWLIENEMNKTDAVLPPAMNN